MNWKKKSEENWGRSGMKYNWLTKTVGELTSYMAKGIPPKYTEKASDTTIYVLNQKCNRDYRISYGPSRLHDTATKKVPDDKMLKSGDVLINSTGTATAGRVAQMMDVPHPTTVDGHMIIMRSTDEIDSLYYGYALKSYQSEIELFAEGSTGQTEINKRRLLDEITILYPDNIHAQKYIASILRVLDDKILLNNKINNNLEQQISAIYKNKFAYVLQGNTSTIEQLIAFSNGKKRPSEDGNIPVYGGNGVLAYTNQSNSENSIIIGRVGAYCGNVFYTSSQCWISDNAIEAKSKVTDSQLFSYYLLRNAELPSRHIGTGQPLMTQGILNAIPCSLPDISEIMAFNSLCEPLQQQIDNNVIEIQQLSLLRDTLLPKLMSGEIDVSNINI